MEKGVLPDAQASRVTPQKHKDAVVEASMDRHSRACRSILLAI